MNTLLNEASSQDQLLKTLETIGFSEISADDFIKKFPEFKDKIRKPIEKVWGLKMRAGAYADTWVMKVDDKYDPYITYIDGNKRMHSGAMFVSSFLNKISGNAKEQLELGEKSDNLSYIGNCTDDEVVDHIFGDASGFANAVEEYGDDFVLDDLVVKYDPKKDIHSFYYKEQFVTEKLSKNQPASVWIKDFIDSTNPKFKGKTKKERISMALGAYYAAQKNEAYDESSPFKANDDSIEYDPEQLAAGIKIEMEHTDDKEIATIIAKHHLAEDPEYYIKLASCVEEYGAGFEGTDELRKKYIKDTPGQRIQQFKTEMKQKTYAIVDVTNDTVVATAHTEMEAKRIVSDTMRRFDNEIDLEIVKSSERPELEEAQNLVSKGIYTLDGKKIDGARSSKLFLQGLDADGFLHDLSWKEWSETDLEDTSSDFVKKQFVDRLAKQIKMFNKRIDLNTWLKGGNRSFIDTVNYIFKLDPNIKYSKASGLKEDAVQEAVKKIACLKCDEVSTEAAWKKNNGFCPVCKVSTQGVAESLEEAVQEAVTPKEISQIKNEFDMELIPQSKWAKTYQTNVRKVKQLYGIPQGNGQYDDVYFVIYDDENKPYGVVNIEGTSQYAKFSDAKAGLKFALNSMSEAYGESWVVYDKNTKAQIKPFKSRKGAYDYAAKSGGVVYSAEYYFDHQDDIKSGKLVKEDTVQEAIDINDYMATSEKSQFGGYTPKVVDKAGKVMYSGQASYNTPDEAKDHAEDYLKQYARGVSDPRVPIKGTYVKEGRFFNSRDYMATSEKSQFGGYRPHVVDKDGKTMYLSQASYNTPDEAKDHAEEYLKQYARGISEPRVPVKGTYVKEEKEHYDSWIIKPREGNGTEVKVKARDEISAIEIALGRKPSQNEIDFFNFHYILIHEKTNVSTLRHMKIVELATKCTDLELVKEFVEQQYKPQTSALQIKESFNSFVSNK